MSEPQDIPFYTQAEAQALAARVDALEKENEDYRYRWSQADAWNTMHRAKLHRDAERAFGDDSFKVPSRHIGFSVHYAAAIIAALALLYVLFAR